MSRTYMNTYKHVHPTLSKAVVLPNQTRRANSLPRWLRILFCRMVQEWFESCESLEMIFVNIKIMIFCEVHHVSSGLSSTLRAQGATEVATELCGALARRGAEATPHHLSGCVSCWRQQLWDRNHTKWYGVIVYIYILYIIYYILYIIYYILYIIYYILYIIYYILYIIYYILYIIYYILYIIYYILYIIYYILYIIFYIYVNSVMNIIATIMIVITCNNKSGAVHDAPLDVAVGCRQSWQPTALRSSYDTCATWCSWPCKAQRA